MREVVFEPNSGLRTIGGHCFIGSQLKEIVIPKSLRVIGEMAFYDCKSLSSLRFEDGSELSHVGFYAFHGTQLTPGSVKYPDTLGILEHGREW